MLHKFNMANCNPVKSPCESSVQLHKRTFDEESADGELYRQMIGSLMFLAQYTRPDIAFAVSTLSQFNKDPSTHHIRAAKHVMRYIQGTKDLCIVFNCDVFTLPIGYSDISYANNPDDRKSISDYIFFYANGIISFQCQKQSVIALSTMESEYMALSDVAKEAIFLFKLLVPSKSIYLIQLSSTPTPSPRLIMLRTTSNTLARNTSTFVIISFAMHAPANTSL